MERDYATADSYDFACSDGPDRFSSPRRWTPDGGYSASAPARDVRRLERKEPTTTFARPCVNYVSQVKLDHYAAVLEMTPSQRAVHDYWRAWANRPKKKKGA